MRHKDEPQERPDIPGERCQQQRLPQATGTNINVLSAPARLWTEINRFKVYGQLQAFQVRSGTITFDGKCVINVSLVNDALVKNALPIINMSTDLEVAAAFNQAWVTNGSPSTWRMRERPEQRPNCTKIKGN